MSLNNVRALGDDRPWKDEVEREVNKLWNTVRFNVTSSNGSSTTRTSTPVASSPNYLINGGFDFWQRGITSTTNAAYIADRWIHSRSAGTHTVSRSTDVPEDAEVQYSLSFASTTGTAPTITQRIESFNSLQFANQPVTVSVWAKSTVGTGGLSWSTAYPTVIDNWAAETADTSGVFTASMVVDSWILYTATFTASALATLGYRISIFRNVTTTSTTTLYAGVQLEFGISATRFKRAGSTYTEEQLSCQRYYYRLTNPSAATNAIASGAYYTTTACYVPFKMPVTMRIGPTLGTSTASNFLILAGGSSRAASAITQYGTVSTDVATMNVTTAAATAGQGAWLETATSGAWLEFSSEL
jgi:hypothetical protein